MKKMVTETMLMPTYVSRFSCIGGDCEDTCCAGWGVTLDKDSFLNYKSCFDPVLRPIFTNHVKRYPHSKSSQDYGHIELAKDGCMSCPLLNEKNLCLVYERLGEKALSDTCTYYPRTIHRFGELHQMALKLSCPEAARLALLEEDAFDFVAQEQTVSLGFITSVQPQSGCTLAEMDEVRTLIFQILRSQHVSLSNRLKVVGLFCERLAELMDKKDTGNLPQLILNVESELETGAALAAVMGHAELPEVQAQVTASLFLAGWKTFQSPHVRLALAEVANGLGIQEGQAPDGPTLVRAYEVGLSRLAPALETVPWLMEHYILNEVLRELFPWGKEGPKRHFATLVLRFATTRLLLAGRAAAREAALTPLELAETIQVACRRYAHDTNFTKNSGKVLFEAGWDDLERLFALL